MFETFVEVNGKQVSVKELEKAVKKEWVSFGNKVKDIEKMNIYFNTTENKAYVVHEGNINKEFVLKI